MLDCPPTDLQRAHGRASVGLGPCGRLERLAQSGSAKAFLPRTHSVCPEVVFLNTAGGLTGGDKLAFELSVDAESRVCGTTQTAERVYRSPGNLARMDVSLSVGRGGRLDWLPQETILFDGAALERRTCVQLTKGASILMTEMIVLGRSAMGESVVSLDFTDRREVLRDNAPVWIEPLRFDTDALGRTGGAGLGDARALATVVFLAAGAEDAAGRAKAHCNADGVSAAASGWDGKLVVRALAPDPWPLRRWLAGLLEQLRGAPLPRVWQV